MALSLVLLYHTAHVPTYAGGVENCFTPPRVHTISQAIYVKGSGGLEVHVVSDTDPFDTVNNEQIDFDAVFKEKYDPSTYSLYVGCGGCVASQDPIVIAPVHVNAYEPMDVEPFTQTSYASVFPKEHRKFNSSLLSHANCDQKHFTVRLVDHMNRTDETPIVWSAVIGLAESFTFLELLEFPIYVIRNHGETWNNAGWTVWIVFIFIAPIVIEFSRMILSRVGSSTLTLGSVTYWDNGIVRRRQDAALREYLYDLALVGFVATMIEEFIHLMIAQSTAPVGWGFWVGLLAVIGFANGLPIWQLTTAAASMRYDPKEDKSEWAHSYWQCSGSPWWAPVEIITGLSYLLLFGAGFYLGPAALTLAGIVRLGELRFRNMGVRRKQQYVEMALRDPRMEYQYPRLFF
jgi:hypothetical protein